MKFNNIVVTNDDGIEAPGLQVAERLAHRLADNVWVFAPAVDQSGKAQALTMHEPLLVDEHGDRRYSVTGTPADCVMVALGTQVMGGSKPDMVISGVNWGHNLSDSVMYSGTVGAALTAAHFDLPAIALSQAFAERSGPNFEAAEALSQAVLETLWQASTGPGFVWNVNFPDCSPDQVAGMRLARQITGSVIAPQITVEEGSDGRPRHWVAFERSLEAIEDRESDVVALRDNYVAAMPLKRERCDEPHLDIWTGMREWPLANDG